jgi:hypothetical protein
MNGLGENLTPIIDINVLKTYQLYKFQYHLYNFTFKHGVECRL